MTTLEIALALYNGPLFRSFRKKWSEEKGIDLSRLTFKEMYLGLEYATSLPPERRIEIASETMTDMLERHIRVFKQDLVAYMLEALTNCRMYCHDPQGEWYDPDYSTEPIGGDRQLEAEIGALVFEYLDQYIVQQKPIESRIQ